MGDFNINLMNYATDNLTSLFLDKACSNSLFLHISISLDVIHHGLTLL